MFTKLCRVNRGTRQDIVCMVDPGMGALHRRATPKAGRRSPEHTGPAPEADGLAERRNRARVVPIGNREPLHRGVPGDGALHDSHRSTKTDRGALSRPGDDDGRKSARDTDLR